MRHVVHFSGGLCSFWAARRVIEKHGPESVTLLFCDTYWEDPSLYVFNMAAEKFLGVKITTLAEGRNPWQLFRDEKMIGSGRADICSRVLKRDILDKWRRENTTPETATFYLGLDWTEAHRLNGTDKKPGGMRAIFAPWRVEAPMMDEPIWDKARMQRELEAVGIALPRLYRLGFPHNNCGGFCVKAGQAHFAHLLKTMPHVYDINEREEEETRKIVGDYSVMKDRRGGGPRRTLTMRQFREEIEAGIRKDDGDWGGCGCSVDFAPMTIYIASRPKHQERWRDLRAQGHKIISTWIDDPEVAPDGMHADLALRCIQEAAIADVTVLYCEPGETLKGALVEVGAALGAGKEVRCVGDCDSVSKVFRKHPKWKDVPTLAVALRP